MDRRMAIMALLTLPLGSFKAFKTRGQYPAILEIHLDDWAGIEVQYAGDRVTLSSADIFKILSTS